VNRTTEPLEVTDNGIPWVIRPSYKRTQKVVDGVMTEVVVGAGPEETLVLEPLPYFAAERAIRQNPIMGTVDPLNPNAFQSLIAVPDWGHDLSFAEQSDAIELLDRSMLGDDAQKAVVIIPRGGRKPPKMTPAALKAAAKQNRGRDGVSVQGLDNPAGIRLSDA
jgi:hypothetical protein